MQIEFGAPVFAVGGKRLGEVEGWSSTLAQRASAIIVDAGLFDRGKHMIGVSAVTRSDQDGLHLDEPTASERSRRRRHSTLKKCHSRSGSNRSRSSSLRRESAGESTRTMRRRPGSIPMKAASSEIARSTPRWWRSSRTWAENEVVLGKETHAISSDHERLGNVIAFELATWGWSTQSRSLRDHLQERSTFPLTEIEEFGTNAVHLGLTRSVAEAR